MQRANVLSKIPTKGCCVVQRHTKSVACVLILPVYDGTVVGGTWIDGFIHAGTDMTATAEIQGIVGRIRRFRGPKSAATPSIPKLVVRKVDFDFAATPFHWVPGDVQTTHTINVLHLLLPEGEKWFCRAFHAVMPRVTDTEVRMQMRGFMGQEAIHSNAHAELLDFLRDHQLNPDEYLAVVDWIFQSVLADKPLNFPLGEKGQRYYDELMIAGVAAIEHFTGLLGTWLLRADRLAAAGADQEMMDLLRWHAAEEVEHQAVAHEVHKHIGGTQMQRYIAMAVVLPLLTGLWVWGVVHLQKRDPIAPSTPTWGHYFRAAKAGLVPTLRYVFGSVPAFYSRSYYPGKGDQAAMDFAVDYLRSAPGVVPPRQATA